MRKYLHLEDDSEAPDKSHQLYMSGNRLSRLSSKFCFRVDLIMKLKSSAYAQNSISLCNGSIEHNLLYAIRKIITDKGEPYGTPLCSGKNFENSLLMRIVIFLLDIKLATYVIIF